MEVVREIGEVRRLLEPARRAGKSIGFVPTMGYLHEGHLSLVEKARVENDRVVVSIFVNPTQFGPGEDSQRYPRDLPRDLDLCARAGVGLVFTPEPSEMYPAGFQTRVEVESLSQGLCGGSRPGHFRGVATVVAKLFAIVQPDRAYFGEKDAQQLRVIERMTMDLSLPVRIVPVPTLRESDGLAMSSRNVYLGAEERRAALVLYRALMLARDLTAAGMRRAAEIKRRMLSLIEAEPMARLDYLAIVDSDTLAPVEELQKPVLIALAVYIGKTRLIDNITVQG